MTTVVQVEDEDKTSIPGPFPGLSDCFLTDQRSFSSERDAKSRLHCEFTLEIDGNDLRLSTNASKCDETIRIRCEDGGVTCRKSASNSGIQFSLKSPTIIDGQATVTLDAEAGNPCAPPGAPDIDIEGKFVIDLDARTVRFDGKVEPFPAFEGYVSIDDGAPVPLFPVKGNKQLDAGGVSLEPLPGTDPWKLYGDPNRLVSGTVRIPTQTTGSIRIDRIFNNHPDAEPLQRTDPDAAAVGIVQGLLIGHGYSKLPNVRSTAYGKYGPMTERMVKDFQKRFGLQNSRDFKSLITTTYYVKY